jgi:microcystin-dependent protein
MAEAFIGEIRLFAFSFAPRGWLLCQGQTLTISDNATLYSLLGTVYGGDGRSNFKLPDLRGRFATQWGQGPLANTRFGEPGGTGGQLVRTDASFTLTDPKQLPAHTHTATFTGTGGGAASPLKVQINVSKDIASTTGGATPIAGGYIGQANSAALQKPAIYTAAASGGTTTLNDATAVASGGGGITGGTVAIDSIGAGEPVTIPLSFPVSAAMPPFLAMNYAICVNGIYPSRP